MNLKFILAAFLAFTCVPVALSSSSSREASVSASFGMEMSGNDITVSNENVRRRLANVRVRKSWDSFTQAEKTLYLEAVQAAMQSQNHRLFTQIHLSDMEFGHAHNSCGFLLWHRKFLLGYENMLRSQNPKFSQVTLPYWNYFMDSAKRMSSKTPCDSIQSCSTFLQDFGGAGGIYKEYGVEGAEISGHCATGGIAKYACAKPDGKNCEACIPRGEWNKKGSNIQFGSAALVEILNAAGASDTPYLTLRERVEGDFHNNIHNTLSGSMASMASTFDPVFYGHHSMVDLVSFLFFRCNIGNDVRAETFQTNPKIFGTCDTMFGDKLTATTEIKMVVNGQDVHVAPETKAYFAGMGKTFVDFANSEQLGAYSYTYEMDAFLQTLIKDFGLKCPLSNFILGANTTNTNNAGANDATNAIAKCGKDTKEAAPELTPAQISQQQAIVECQALKAQANGNLRSFSDKFRALFMIREDREPFCLDLLNKVARGEIQVITTETCVEAIQNSTGVTIHETATPKPTTVGFGGDRRWRRPTVVAPVMPTPTTVSPASTTKAPVTEAPVTVAPVTPTPTTVVPAATTKAPVTVAPVTPTPTTVVPAATTKAPVTVAPHTPAPTTKAPVATTTAPVTAAPYTHAPMTKAPAATTTAPVTAAPYTPAPMTNAPAATTNAPVATTEAPLMTTKTPVANPCPKAQTGAAKRQAGRRRRKRVRRGRTHHNRSVQ